jgi:predicted SAM-dependent methyltransferase
MDVKKRSYLRASLLILIGFFIGLGTADSFDKAFRSPWFRFGDSRAIAQYLQSHPVRKLQLGAGGNDPPGWLNTDIEPYDKEVYLDATGRYPFPDGSFQYVFSEHLIEHVSWEAGLMMLRECYRVLAKGGKLRIVTPNLAKYIQLLDGNADNDVRQFIDAKLRSESMSNTPIPGVYILNHEARAYGHKFLYDPPALRMSLETAGFKQITQYEVKEVTDPVFQEVEMRSRHWLPDVRLVNNWGAMAFEAVR